MNLNYEELHIFFEGMKISREQHAEENKSFELGVNGRLHSRNGKLSYSSIKGTIEVYNDPNIVKYLGYFAFFDELALLVKYDSRVVGDSTVINNEAIFGDDVVINIPFGGVQYNFTNELTLNASEEITTISVPILPEELSPLQNNYDETVVGETIDLSSYYTLGSSNVPDYEICDTGGIDSVPEYNKEYADAIIVLTKEDNKTFAGRIAWLGNMNWDINRKITTVGIYENNYYKRVYFTDNLNPLRVFNLKDNSLNYRVADEFSINQKSTLLQPYVFEINDNGSIKAMSVQYAYLLITENGQATPFSPYSELQLIVKDSDDYDFAGGEVEEKTSKAVKIKCPVISTLYKEIQAIAIEYEADTIPTAIRNLGKKDVSEIVEFIHTGNESEYIENITLDDIIETDNIWTYCNDITTKNNKLIAAGLRNEPYTLQEKYISDLFLFKGWDINGNTHNSLINPEPQTYDHFDPTSVEQSLYLKKQLFIRFLFFGNTTLTLRNKTIPDSEKSIVFTSSSDQYIEYIDKVFDWLSGLDLTDFPNLSIVRSNKSILFTPVDELLETDFSNYIFETSVSQVIIDFDNEWAIKEPAINVGNLIYGAQSYGYNRGSGIRISWKEVKEPILKASPELYVDGPILDLQTPSLKKTFVKDEIYRISCQFFKSGTPLFAIVCGDVKTPKIGAVKKYLSNSGNPVITSELYSNQSELTEINSAGDVEIKLLVHRLEMICEVRIPCEFKEQVDSFQIQYVERTENNRTVLAQGISAPLVRLASFRNPSQAGINFAPNVYDKWTLPFNGGPLYGIHGLLQVYDAAGFGENWNDIEDYRNEWDDNQAVKDRVMRREIPNRRMFYFDSPDMIHGRISEKNIANGKIQVLGRLNTDHTQNLIRSRYPYDGLSGGGIFSGGHPEEGIHNHYELTRQEDKEVEVYKELSFSRKIGYTELAGVETKKPWTVNISIFSKFQHYSAEHTVEKASELLNKGQIIPSAVLGTSFESVNMALTLFAQHAYNSSLWFGGFYSDRKDVFRSETGQSSNQSEGYPTVFIRANDDVFTNDLIGEHVTDPIYVKAHTHEGNAKNVDINGLVGNNGGWVGVPNTDSHALINIKMNNESSIYGGRNKYAFSQNIFIPLSKVIPTAGATASNQAQRFTVQGDFYTSLYLRTKNDFSNILDPLQHKMYQDNSHGGSHGKHSVTDWNRGGAWAYGVVLETEVESRLSGEYRFYRSDGSVDFSITLAELINSAYFKKNNLRIYNSVPWNFKDDPLLTNILSASKTKLNGDIFDAWTKFLLNEFYELEKAKGIITNVTNWGDEIYAIQEFESNKVNIDTSDFITTESGQRVSVQKGAGQTFTSHEKISDFGTSIRRALAEGEWGFSFFDEYNKAFIKISKPLSLEKELQQKLQELFNDDPIIDTEGYYDTEYKETNIRIRTKGGNTYMLSYNELLQVFNGYIEYDNDIYIMFDKRVFSPISGNKTTTVICPSITSSLNLDLDVGEYFNYQITADNEPTSYDAVGLPSGVLINKNTGVIYGIIDTAGTYNIDISASNECGTTQLQIQVAVVGLAPIITSACFDPVQAGNAFSYQIVAINNPTTFNASNLPAGLTISPTGLISGTLPISGGTYTVTMSATNAFGTGTKQCSLVVEVVVTNCDKLVQTGNQGSFSYVMPIGQALGTTGFNRNNFSVPVRFRLEYNGVIVADSKYVGYNNYDGLLLSEGIDPADINTAPNPGTGVGQITFRKVTADPQEVTVHIDAPLSGSFWNVSGVCPVAEEKVVNTFVRLNSCQTEWVIYVKCPAGETRQVHFTATFATGGSYSTNVVQVGTQIVSDTVDVITADTEYTVGVDGSNSSGTLAESSILIQLKDATGTTVIHQQTYKRNHGPNKC